MKEQTPDKQQLEEKAKFFLQYFLQKGILIYGRWVDIPFQDFPKKAHLLLKPLSMISDEDAIEVARMVGANNYPLGIYTPLEAGRELCRRFDELISKDGVENFIHPAVWVQVIDYLRSKSHALPYLIHSVEEMIKMNWIKLIEG